MSRAKMVAINGEKLKAHILTTGKTLADASEEMGYHRDYLNGCVRENKITRQGIALIGLMLNIPGDLFVVKEEAPEPEPQTEEPQTIMEMLKAIRISVEKIEKYMEVKNYEQTTWNLPFGDISDSGCIDDHIM